MNRLVFLCCALTLILCGCAETSSAPTTTAPSVTTTTSAVAPVTDDPTVTTFTATIGSKPFRVDVQTPEGYRASVGNTVMTLPIEDATSAAFIATGELEPPYEQYSLRISKAGVESGGSYIVQLTAGFFPSEVYSAIRKDTAWEPLGDLTSKTGITYSAFRVDTAYYLVASFNNWCVIIATSAKNEAIDLITFTPR